MKSGCRVRDKGFDDVAVRAHDVDGVAAVVALHARVPLAHRSAARVCIARIDSPPGNAAAEGCACSTSISGSSFSSASLRPDQSP